MSDQFVIHVNLDDDTKTKLGGSGQSLRAYKGVKTGVANGLSPVWFMTNDFGDVVDVKWQEQYCGYVNSIDLKPGAVVDAHSVKPMTLGQLLTTDDFGVATVDNNGQAGDITIHNKGHKEWTCGMGQKVGGVMSPSCSFKLFGTGYTLLMMPYEEVLLVFESGQIDTGTLVEETISSSIVITLTGDARERTVSFNIDNGWDAQQASWATIYTNSIKIADKLIHQDNSLRSPTLKGAFQRP